ncbi:MAG: hypothetical protein J6D21_07910 [Clostridia bacterium]|nr:hypothetical protein [Clostridia bacterium]
MVFFTRGEIGFLKECYVLHKKDGYISPFDHFDLSENLQESLFSSAFKKLTSNFLFEPLNPQEASVLLMAIHHVSKDYIIDEIDFDLRTVYNKVASIAGVDPLE